MDYIPQPIDTKDVELPEDVKALADVLARNVHEVWSEERLKDGWTYGLERNDALKQTPCLVPYSQLDEKEKVYDRNTALETLKLILKLGYKIVRTEN